MLASTIIEGALHQNLSNNLMLTSQITKRLEIRLIKPYGQMPTTEKFYIGMKQTQK